MIFSKGRSGVAEASRAKCLIPFGGVSTEHEVSMVTLANLLPWIRKRVDPVLLYVHRDGSLSHVETASIPFVSTSAEISRAIRLHDATILTEPRVAVRTAKDDFPIECVFPLIHGTGGEDGSFAKLAAEAGLPYSGPSPVFAMLSLDKGLMRAAIARTRLPQPRWYVVPPADVVTHELVNFVEEVGWPIVVKPATGGSSIGVSVVDSLGDLADAIGRVAGDSVIIEEYVRSTEISVYVGDWGAQGSLWHGPLVEHELHGLFTYEAKCVAVPTSYRRYCPARLSPAEAAKLHQFADMAYLATSSRSLVRVDFLRTDTELLLLELNSIPGFRRLHDRVHVLESHGEGIDWLMDHWLPGIWPDL